MTIFDLLFLAAFGSTVIVLIVVAVKLVSGHRREAVRLLGSLGIGIAIYVVALLLVSALTPQRYIGIADRECSDDWCIAVESVHRQQMADRIEYDVAFRLSSRARRVAQRERFVDTYLLDNGWHRHPTERTPSDVPFDTLIQAGASIVARRRYVVPANATIVGVVVARDGAGRFPGCCIIGDENSFFHRLTVIRLDSVASP